MWWVLGAVVALGVAVVFVVVDTGGDSEGWRWVVLRWFHSLCWVCLAGAALAKSGTTPLPETWAGPLAAAGGVLYLIFIAVSLAGRGPAGD